MTIRRKNPIELDQPALFELAPLQTDITPRLTQQPPKRTPTDPTPWTSIKGDAPAAAFVVLASSSGGNCSAIIHGAGLNHRITLIDCGLSPRKTRASLAKLGLDADRIDRVILTHLDADHCRDTWVNALPPHARFWIHKRHRSRASRMGMLRRKTEIFEDSFTLPHGISANVALQAHDEYGVAAFRFNLPRGDNQPPATLGYATDLGRATGALIDTLQGVETLAIESNYCPRMQIESNRPDFLKSRIMDGSGHLSNQQCREAVNAIAPKERVVLLHLSRQCNTPDAAAIEHLDAPYELLIASHAEPTPIITLVEPTPPR